MQLLFANYVGKAFFEPPHTGVRLKSIICRRGSFYIMGFTKMKNSLLTSVAAIGILAGTTSANAQSGPVIPSFGTWYVSLFGGAAFPDSLDTTASYAGVPGFIVDFDTETGYVLGVAAGANITSDLRTEVEYSYSSSDSDTIDYARPGGAVTSYAANGEIESHFVLVNLWYDWNVGSTIRPYLGGGIGVGVVDVNADYTNFPTFPTSDSDVGFAFQLGAGVRVPISAAMDFDLSYRFKGVTGLDYENFSPGAGGIVTRDADSFYSHNVTGGVTFKFNGP